MLPKASMGLPLKIYCDTSVLPSNIDPKTREKEHAALKQLAEKHSMFVSHLVRYEAMNTPDKTKRDALIRECEALEPVPKDEKLLGYYIAQHDRTGFLQGVRISDVQNEWLRQELMDRGCKQRDAEYITQAICNDCDVFLTLDDDLRRNNRKEWLEAYLSLKIRRPSELLAELSAQLALSSTRYGARAVLEREQERLIEEWSR
jgi:predicted nucleic acid-binding protein